MADPICILCEEPIRPWEQKDHNHRQPIHIECGIRSVIGGINHQRGLCICCGGTEDPDPPNVSRRIAAVMAADYFWEQQLKKVRP